MGKMRDLSIHALFLSLVFTHSVAYPQVRKSILKNGNTVLTEKSGKLSVSVEFHTREIDIGKPSKKKPSPPQYNCTNSRFPCSVVDSIVILVNDSPLWIPKSIICGMTDLNRAELDVQGKEILLGISGGDASESYLVKIKFDKDRVLNKQFYSALDSSHMLEEINYSAPVTLE